MNTSLVSSRSPRLVKANKTEVPKCARIERERERELKGAKGWILIRKVVSWGWKLIYLVYFYQLFN